MTYALTKYVELVPLHNKEATTVAAAIFDKWFCHFGASLDLVTDQGKEFCAKLSHNLFKKLGITHLTTSPHHPQCNSQAEVTNKTIAKYFCQLLRPFHTQLGTLLGSADVFLQYQLPSLNQDFSVLFNIWDGAETTKLTDAQSMTKILWRIVY